MSKNHKSEIINENGKQYITDGYYKIRLDAFKKIIEDNKQEGEEKCTRNIG